jgi:anti-sigma regulatory factor (Ser/Thr protein kinase)
MRLQAALAPGSRLRIKRGKAGSLPHGHRHGRPRIAHQRAPGRASATILVPRNWPLSKATPPLAALPTVPAVARAFVCKTLLAWHLEPLVGDAKLVISELASNAVAASTGRCGHPVAVSGRLSVIRVGLLTDGERVLLEVWDQAPGIPEPREADGSEESGRGLVLIHAIAHKWGWHPAAGETGKVMRAVMTF